MNPTASDIPEWHCLRTQTKREHLAAEHLRLIEGVEIFCPRLRYRKATRRGTVWWMEPMFPGYLLAKFDRNTLERAVTYSHGIRGMVRFGSQVPTIDDAMIRSLRDEIRDRTQDHPESDILTTSPVIELGDDVEVAHGPLQGMRGQVVSILPAAERVRILLEFLGQVHPVDLDLFSLILPKRTSLTPV